MTADQRAAAIRARLESRLGHVLANIDLVLQEQPKIKRMLVAAFRDPLSPSADPAPIIPPFTAAEALEFIRTERETLTSEATAHLAGLITALIPKPLQDAVSARAMEAWGWPDTSIPGHVLTLLANVCGLTESIPRWRWWPMDVAPLSVAHWAPFMAHAPLDAADLERFAKNGDIWALGCVRFVGPAWLYRAAQSVEQDRARKAIAIDAGRPHHDLLMGWRDIPKSHSHKKHAFEVSSNDQVELFGPGLSVQLHLDLDEDGTATAAVIRVLRDMRGWRALRHWAALLRLLSVEGHRRGWVRWTLDAHLDAMNIPAANRRNATVRQNAIQQVEAFTQLELVVFSSDGTERERRPLVLIGSRFDKLQGSTWELNGLELAMNPLLYSGVREDTGQLGSNWHPAPVELAHVDEGRHPYTLALGLILPTRWRLAANEGRDHITLSGGNVLKLAGIPYSRADPAKAWRRLDRDLGELKKIGGLGRFEWQSAPRTLAGMISLWPAEWASDRTQHGVRPIEPPPGESVLTGADLKTWRATRGLSQAVAATQLGVSRWTVIRAERAPEHPLTTNLAKKIRTPPITGTLRVTLDDLTLSAEGKVGKAEVP